MKKFISPLKKVLRASKGKRKVGLPPGTLEYSGDNPEIETKVIIIDYNEDIYNLHELETFKIDFNKFEKDFTRWIKVRGFSDIELIELLGKQFNLHPLVLEDILSQNQRPKFEDYENYIFIVIRRLFFDNEKEDFQNEQISLILGENYVISFQEQESEIFNPILERIKIPKGKVRIMGPDYLVYTLIDVIIDNYFVVIEMIGEIIENIEDELIQNPKPETLKIIYRLKRKTIDIRKLIWPTRELINQLQREQSKLIMDNLQIYLRDIYDHIFRITDLLENYRDIIFGMLDMYLSSVSNKMNEIMKVLTIISTIFIPLSFLAGFYGMNFLYMPEFSNPFAYPILISIMMLITLLMLYFFKRKRWL
jgi:magnesium transporter